MSEINIKIKHAGKVYPIAVSPSENGLTLKLQISSLTDVPPDRQKVLVRGGPLKDDAILSTLGFKEGQTIMVLGTPLEKVIKADETVAKFVEDEGLVKANADLPSGLVNLGNTCYLNSSIQSLNVVDEMKQTLIQSSKHENDSMVKSMGELFSKIDEGKGSVTPLNFLSALRRTYPQFAERDQQMGFYKQQDAEEAYSQIMQAVLRSHPELEKLFQIEFKTETKCLEVDNDTAQFNYEDSLKLSCHITAQTNFLQDGLKQSMKETIEKNNEALGRNAQYEITKKITKLPKYLTVHFVRFFWKRETGKKAKIMRKVQFPFQLDLFDLLDESIKEEKSQMRDSIYKIEKENEDESRQFKKQKPNVTLTSREQLEKQKQEYKDLQNKWSNNFKKVIPEQYFTNGENPSCIYDLAGIIAHQGASADSGHYQAFIKDQNDLTGDRWYKFNDDKVSVIDREKVLALAGGSEGDSALIMIYKAYGV
ncbi:ubiquitin-specific protease [Martiniozyma asiatica (nom. inval.)]|nr:ubiquitin-specific protease [Martiniozyma asiatica]